MQYPPDAGLVFKEIEGSIVMSRLIVTNGQSGVDNIEQAGIMGEVMSWDDVLHDGPVPGGYSLAVTSEMRARYLTSVGSGDFEEIHDKFKSRDKKLEAAASYEELVLFFEHDLYDQLQLLQILELLHKDIHRPSRMTIAHPPTYIGHCTPEMLMASYESRVEIPLAIFELGSAVWRAFTAESPEELGELLSIEEPALPHLPEALRRLAEEYPDHMTELSRTERQILIALNNGPQRVGVLFKKVQDMEDAVFMGDWSFVMYLKALCKGNQPLVKPVLNGAGNPLANDYEYSALMQASFEITNTGYAVLNGDARKSAYLDIERWIGGTHITSVNLWCWNPTDSIFEH